MAHLEPKHKKALIIGAMIGALLGAGAAWLLLTAPADLEAGEPPSPISAGDILKLTGTAASLLNLLDNLRHRL